jgi:hypothetical protein
MTKGIAVPSVQLDVIPAPHNKDKTTPPSSGGQYGDPPSKYDPTRWVYEPTHYGMGFMTAALTFEAIQANEDHDLELGIMDTSSASSKTTNDLGRYQLPYDFPGRSGGDDEGHDETMSHRTASESPP